MVDALILLALSPVLALAAASDLRRMRIPNNLVAVLPVAFLIVCPFLGLSEAVLRLVVAAGVLGVGCVAYLMRAIGGGDVKFLAALMLFVPTGSLVLFGYVFSATLLVGVAVTLTLQSAPVAHRLRWTSVRARGHFPMGVSIGLAGFAHALVLLAASQGF